MNKSEQKRFDGLYSGHLRAMKLQGMSDKTIDAATPKSYSGWCR